MRGHRWSGWDFGREIARAAQMRAVHDAFAGGGAFRGWTDDGEGRGGGRARRMFAGSDLRMVLLKLIADEPRHGYELIREIEAMSNGAYVPSPGVIYPALTMMAEEELIEEQASEGAKKRYAITAEGRAKLERQLARVEALMERLSSLGQQRRSSPERQVYRAQENLRNAIRLHRHSGNLVHGIVEQIVDIIDDAARKIERLG